MLNVSFASGPEYRILCLGAHSDDIEIGCGGTVLRLMEAYSRLTVQWVVLGAQGRRADEAETSAHAFLQDAYAKEVVVKRFRDGFFPYTGVEIKEYFEELNSGPSPDLIFTHYRHDRHQDHRVASDLTWNTFRDHLILEYEIPKYDGDLGNPNLHVPLDEGVCRRKIEHLMTHFPSQGDRQWFSEDTFLALLRLRGIEAGSQCKYAEAFYGRKLVLKTAHSSAGDELTRE